MNGEDAGVYWSWSHLYSDVSSASSSQLYLTSSSPSALTCNLESRFTLTLWCPDDPVNILHEVATTELPRKDREH